jgi:hypothetical protein
MSKQLQGELQCNSGNPGAQALSKSFQALPQNPGMQQLCLLMDSSGMHMAVCGRYSGLPVSHLAPVSQLSQHLLQLRHAQVGL